MNTAARDSQQLVKLSSYVHTIIDYFLSFSLKLIQGFMRYLANRQGYIEHCRFKPDHLHNKKKKPNGRESKE